MESEVSSSSPLLHVVMFPWFAFGHINPFVQLSNKLSSHGIQISFFSAPRNIPNITLSLKSSHLIKIIPIHIPTIEGLSPGLDNTSDMPPPQTELLKIALDQMQPQIKSLLINLKPHIVFFDFAQYWLPSIASPLGIKTLYFSVFAAVGTYLMAPTRLINSINGESPSLEDLKKPPPGFPSISSIKTFQARDILYVFKSFHGGPSVHERDLTSKKSCDAIVLKSCNEMEGPYIDFIKTQYGKPVLLAGPLVPDPPKDQLEEKWVKWLDSFPSKSVVFCSFGSETYLKDEDIKELVLGLESTGLPFFVVLNFPAGEDSKQKLKTTLPEGFEERVKEKGVVHTGWVQQQLILAHESVGCFVCHSGFSSVTEGLINDCQLVLLPQKGDQFLNSMLVSGDLRAGIEVIREDENGYFGKEDLCKAVKTLMVDVNEEPAKSIRANHGTWREFLLDKEVHERYIRDLVTEMRTMVGLDYLLMGITGAVSANIHRRVLTESEFGKDISVGSVLILKKDAVLSPSHSAHYHNITKENLHKKQSAEGMVICRKLERGWKVVVEEH